VKENDLPWYVVYPANILSHYLILHANKNVDIQSVIIVNLGFYHQSLEALTRWILIYIGVPKLGGLLPMQQSVARGYASL
jgi:hypothetical protein